MNPQPFDQLRKIVARLRAADGCPWDREQTHSSLRGHLIEEAYEVVDAIDRNNDADLREELGDFLLQVVLHAQIASEDGRFTLDDVAKAISEKLVRRHPHVFGDTKLDNTAEVLTQWEQIKRAEKSKNGVTPSVLDGVARALPGLLRANDIQKKAARAGFDWAEAVEVLVKVREELSEAEFALHANEQDNLEEELGDLLFAVVNLARKSKIDPEVAMHKANEKFVRRFKAMEKLITASGRKLEDCDLAAMDEAWNQVKKTEKA